MSRVVEAQILLLSSISKSIGIAVLFGDVVFPLASVSTGLYKSIFVQLTPSVDL